MRGTLTSGSNFDQEKYFLNIFSVFTYNEILQVPMYSSTHEYCQLQNVCPTFLAIIRIFQKVSKKLVKVTPFVDKHFKKKLYKEQIPV